MNRSVPVTTSSILAALDLSDLVEETPNTPSYAAFTLTRLKDAVGSDTFHSHNASVHKDTDEADQEFKRLTLNADFTELKLWWQGSMDSYAASNVHWQVQVNDDTPFDVFYGTYAITNDYYAHGITLTDCKVGDVIKLQGGFINSLECVNLRVQGTVEVTDLSTSITNG